jgi:hypothetical protein
VNSFQNTGQFDFTLDVTVLEEVEIKPIFVVGQGADAADDWLA